MFRKSTQRQLQKPFKSVCVMSCSFIHSFIYAFIYSGSTDPMCPVQSKSGLGGFLLKERFTNICETDKVEANT